MTSKTPLTKSYNVGWYYYTPEQLESMYPGDFAQYREMAQSIMPFGSTEACWKDTPQEAEDFLKQIVSVNSAGNLKALTPLGADGLFIVERERIGGATVKLSRHKPQPRAAFFAIAAELEADR